MPAITPFLWFESQAQEAAKFYTTVFPDSKLLVDSSFICEIELLGQKISLLNGGAYDKFNPTISFFVSYKAGKEVIDVYNKLKEGSKELMPLGEYPFSKQYVWFEDKFGLSWQISQSDSPINKVLFPSIMFVGQNNGKAQEAIDFYTELFPDSKTDFISRYGESAKEPNKSEHINYSNFHLGTQTMGAMDGGTQHNFQFNDAISWVISTKDQAETDYYWDKLTADEGKAKQCGWLTDKYGMTWQVVPKRLVELMTDKDHVKAGKMRSAMMKMVKIDIAGLEEAYNQE